MGSDSKRETYDESSNDARVRCSTNAKKKQNAENRHHLHPTACHLVPLRARPMVTK
jgi:hypothetical protein